MQARDAKLLGQSLLARVFSLEYSHGGVAIRISPRRAALTAVALAEYGGALGAASSWLYLVGRTLIWEGPLDGQQLLGAGVWALFAGVPIGAATMTLLGMTVLRRVPLARALAYPAAGALLGLGVGACFSRGVALPVPPVVVALVALGVLGGTRSAILKTVRETRRSATSLASAS